jgi:hypothetical protein
MASNIKKLDPQKVNGFLMSAMSLVQDATDLPDHKNDERYESLNLAIDDLKRVITLLDQEMTRLDYE